jgi:predicted AAA+ superfamily ATPase
VSALLEQLSPELERNLRDFNPWWAGQPQPPLPTYRRWLFEPALRKLQEGLAPCVALRGPRQVGKSTLLRQMMQHLLDNGTPATRLLYVPFDELPAFRALAEPVLQIARWFSQNILRETFNAAARTGPVFLFFDEVQNLNDWAPQLKSLVDNHAVRVFATGSSALRIEAGRDSLAGRLTTLEIGPLLLREVGGLREGSSPDPFLPANGWETLRTRRTWEALRHYGESHANFRRRAFAAFSERGAYPVAHVRPDTSWEDVAEQLTQNVILRVIQHDLRLGERGKKRDEALLREVFRLACIYVGQSPSQATYLTELRRGVHANLGWQRVLAYLRFLDGTLLLRLVEPLELRLKRKRGASKLCLCDHALRAAWLREVIPLTPDGLVANPWVHDLAGRIAESVVGYFFKSIYGLGVHHFPERGAEPEVDFILTVGEQRIPVEVKYRHRIDHADTRGLRAFMEKAHYNAPFALLVTLDDAPGSDDPRIVSLPLSTLLLLR